MGVCMCGMNFQNFFWRIESLHQRTLIRILYEFLFFISSKYEFYLMNALILFLHKHSSLGQNAEHKPLFLKSERVREKKM